MNARTSLLLAASLLLASIVAPATASPEPQAFERNDGQADPSASFVTRGDGYEALVSAEGLAFSLPTAGPLASMRIRFAGARETAHLAGEDELPGKVHYLEGPTAVPTYATVASTGLYPGIDLAYRADFRRLDLELVFAPGADRDAIRLAPEGTDGFDVETSSGDLILAGAGARLRIARPVAAQELDGVATSLPADFVRRGGEVELRVPGVREDAPLRVRIRVTRDDVPDSRVRDTVRVATDPRGNVYVTGQALGRGAFVAKLRAADLVPLSTTYLDAGEGIVPLAIGVDADGEAIVAGRDGSRSFAARLRADGSGVVFRTRLGEHASEARAVSLDERGNAWIAGRDANDAFVARLDRDGAVRAMARLGGSGDDAAAAIRVDLDGDVLVAGTTTSTDFPVDGAPQPTPGGAGDAFVARLRPDGRVVWATYLGGTGDDVATALDVDGSGLVVVAGRSAGNAFAVAVDRDRASRVWTADLGASPEDAAIALGSGGNAWVTDGTSLSKLGADGRLVSRSPRAAALDVAVGAGDGPVVAGILADESGSSPVQPARTGGVIHVTGSGEAPAAAGCPGTINFDNSAGTGLWQTTTNWDLDRLPIATDDVCVGGAFTAVLSSGTQTVNTLFVNTGASLQLSAGTLSLAAASTIQGGFTFSGGTLTGAGTLTIDSSFGWSAGTMTGAGTVNANGGITISSTGTKLITSSRILNTAGATTWTGTGTIQVGTGGVVNNNGTWDAQNDATMNNPFGGTAAFNNTAGAGRFFQKSVGTGTTNITVPFHNAGLAKVLTGTLSLNSGGTHTGTFTGSPGTTLAFDGGTHALSVGSTTTADFVDLGSGTVTVDGAYTATVGTTVSGATATFNPAATLSSVGSALAVSSGTVTFNSGEAVNPTTLAFTGGTIQGSDTVTMSGLTTWSAGTMTGAGTVNANGGIAFSSTGTKTITSSRILNTAGATTWTGTGTIQVGTGGVVNNNGTWDAQSDATMNNPFGGTAAFNNTAGAGRFFQKSVGTGTTDITVPFQNAGLTKVLTGTLSLNSGGTHTGTFTGSPGTTLVFDGGTHALSAGSTTTADFVDLGSGTVTVDGAYTATAGTTVSGATATFNPAATLSSVGSALAVSSGTVTFNSGEAVNPTTLAFTGGTIQGSDTVTVSGLTTWSAGTMTGTGTVNTNGGISFSSTGTKAITSSRILNTAGATTWAGTGTIQVSTGAVVNNNGTWDAQSDATMNNPFGGTAAFNNTAGAGRFFQKSVGTGTTNISIPFSNAGLTKVLTGTLSLNSGGTHTGTFTGSPGTTLAFDGGTHALSAGSTTTADFVDLGSGTVTIDGAYTATAGTTVSGATATFNPAATLSSVGSALTVSSGTVTFSSGEAVNPATLAFTGGTIQGSDTVTVSGLTTWSAGTMTGAGTVNANGGISFSSTGTKTITSSRILNTAGTTTWAGTGTIQVSTGAVVNNNGTWDAQSDATMNNPFGGTAAFGNAGTFQKSAGTGTTTISISLTTSGAVQALAGTLSFAAPTAGFTQTAGTTTLNGGAITSTTTMSIQGGTLQGVGTLTANVSSDGQTAPGLSPGILNETGSYTQGASGSLAIEIGGLTAGTQYDRLTVTGTATLAGTLNATLVNGFVPAHGDTFTVLTYGSRTGSFATLNLPPLAAGWYWIHSYGATSLTLTAILDSDNDGRPNVDDCAPFDAGAFAIPLEVTGDAIAADKQTLSWTSAAPTAGSATVHDVMRGVLRQFPVGSGAGETCLANGVAAASTTDAATPAPGAGVYYLVRGTNVCGTGTYGFATSGAERITAACP